MNRKVLFYIFIEQSNSVDNITYQDDSHQIYCTPLIFIIHIILNTITLDTTIFPIFFSLVSLLFKFINTNAIIFIATIYIVLNIIMVLNDMFLIIMIIIIFVKGVSNSLIIAILLILIIVFIFILISIGF